MTCFETSSSIIFTAFCFSCTLINQWKRFVVYGCYVCIYLVRSNAMKCIWWWDCSRDYNTGGPVGNLCETLTTYIRELVVVVGCGRMPSPHPSYNIFSYRSSKPKPKKKKWKREFYFSSDVFCIVGCCQIKVS